MDPGLSRLKLASLALAFHPFPTARLFEVFSSPEGILAAASSELKKAAGLKPSEIRSILSFDVDLVGAQDLAELKKREVHLVSYDESRYPENLRQIPDPPPVLFMKGTFLASDWKALAVVGSRRASPYGISVCETFSRSLAAEGFCIISGMALGIDAVAHWTALESGGRTIGVLGTGLDRVYPQANSLLFERIPSQGALVSEFPFGTLPLAWNFPRRNRLISGMALGVLVIEASERSGTAITVRMALEQGREVFAVPGDIRSPTSRGTHRLIKDGAKVAESVQDILDELCLRVVHETPPGSNRNPPGTMEEQRDFAEVNPTFSEGGRDRGPAHETRPRLALCDHASTVLQMIGDEGTSVERLVLRTGWPAAKIAGLLTELELLGKVQKLRGNRYVRSE